MVTKKWLAALTPKQTAMLPAIRDKWIAIGLSTEPTDRRRAESAARLAYRRADLTEPSLLIWLRSPMAGALGAAFLKELQKRAPVGAHRASIGASVWASVRDSVGASVRESVWDSIGASVWASVWDSVGASVGASVAASVRNSVEASVWESVGESVRKSVGESVRKSVWESVWASVGESVGESIRASVWDSVRESVWESVWASVGASVGESVWASVWASVEASVGYGQHDASWIGFLDAFREFGLEDIVKRADGLTALTQSAGWYWPFKGACILTERHSELRRDEHGRLHSDRAAAVKYPDGWAVYAWHGVHVAEAVILHPELITIANVRAEQNAEVRRVLLERYGFDRYIADSGSMPIHADETGTLYRCELDGDEPLVLVSVLNSTPESNGELKRYFLRVPPDMTQARQAVAWSFGRLADAYRPIVET